VVFDIYKSGAMVTEYSSIKIHYFN